MTEYQYYEFRAVDSPLTKEQQAELRSRSSRATITATSFINEYHFGNLKGEPVDWMQRYFDAHVYSANWGSCNFMLRVPIAALDQKILAQFTVPSQTGAQSNFGDAFAVTKTANFWILDWSFNDESGEHERFWHGDGDAWMGSLLPLRDELLRGDTRPLYLGWLARVCNEELADDDVEPPLPAGLQTLTPAQYALTEFLMIDPDWLATAASNSPVLPDRAIVSPDMDNWLSLQSPNDKQATLRLLLEGRCQEAERALKQRYLLWQREQSPASESAAPITVAEIDQGRELARAKRLEIEQQKRLAQEAKRLAERNLLLARIAANAPTAWAAINKALQHGTGKAYDQALQDLKDLAEALTQAGRTGEFNHGLAKLQCVHGKRGAWVKRLTDAGIHLKDD